LNTFKYMYKVTYKGYGTNLVSKGDKLPALILIEVLLSISSCSTNHIYMS